MLGSDSVLDSLGAAISFKFLRDFDVLLGLVSPAFAKGVFQYNQLEMDLMA